MSETIDIELSQGKTWQIDGTIYDVNGILLNWTDYAVRSQGRKKYTDASPAFTFTATLGTDGKYTLFLGADVTATIAQGSYVCDVEVYKVSDATIVHEASRLNINVLPEATK